MLYTHIKHPVVSTECINAAHAFSAKSRLQQRLKPTARLSAVSVLQWQCGKTVCVACSSTVWQQQEQQCRRQHTSAQASSSVSQRTQEFKLKPNKRRSSTAYASDSAAAMAAVEAPSCTSSSSHSSRAPEMCVIVDENNNVVGAATRFETVSKRLLGRGSYVLVFNGAGQLFVSRRSAAKDCYPGCLDVVISGVVNQGEEYAETAARELQEEVAIPFEASRQQLQQLFIFPYKDDVCHVWGCAFLMTWDGSVAFSDAEVQWGRFMDLAELQQQLEQEPDTFTPVGRHVLGLYFAHRAKQ